MPTVIETIALATSETKSYVPKQREVITSWQLTAVGAGEVTFTPVIMGETTHEGFVLSNSSVHVDLFGVESWNLTEGGSGSATCRVIQSYNTSYLP